MSYQRPERVGYVVMPPDEMDAEPRLYLMHLPDGEPQMLTGSAALIWVLAADGEPDVVGALADLLAEPVEKLADDVDAYLARLIEQGFLEGDVLVP